MEHACEKCGASVEDGVPFCKHCGTPQIRVAGFEQQPISPISPVDFSHFAPQALQWPHALPAVATAGLVAAVSMLFPLGGLGVGLLIAGYLSVRLYQRRTAISALPTGVGAKLGALTGTLGFAFFIIFTSIEVLVFHSGGELHDDLIQVVQQSISRATDPQARQALEFFTTPAGLAVMMTMGLAVMFVVFLVLTSVGGALGASLLRRKPGP